MLFSDKIKKVKKIKFPPCVFVILAVMSTGFFFIQNKPYFIDESPHLGLIKKMAEFNFSRDTFEIAAMFPFYHLVLGLLSRVTGSLSLSSLRFISTIFSFFSVLVFYLIAKQIESKNAVLKTFQYLFLPILFIFFFLVYTDAFSLLLILLSFYFLNKERYKTSGLFGLFSVLTRQNNIIWLAFFVLLMIMKNFKSDFNKKSMIKFLSDAAVFILIFFGFGVFVILNNGFVLSGMKEIHPLSIHFSNLFLFLLFQFILFLPLNIANFPKIFKVSIRIFRKRPWIVFPIGIFFIFYIFAFKVDHPFNQNTIDYFLRNRILAYITGSDLTKSFFFIPIFYSILSLAVSEFNKKIYYFIYPFILINLCLFWLVEPRYYLVPFVFFLLFKKQKSLLVEGLNIIIFMILSGWIVWGAISQKFFL